MITVFGVDFQVNAVFAADAVSRLSGTIGVAAVTAGPGVTNTVTAMKNAQMAQSPLLLIGGAASTILKVCALEWVLPGFCWGNRPNWTDSYLENLSELNCHSAIVRKT